MEQGARWSPPTEQQEQGPSGPRFLLEGNELQCLDCGAKEQLEPRYGALNEAKQGHLQCSAPRRSA